MTTPRGRRWRLPDAADVTGHNSSSEVDLRPEDVILIDVRIDLTSGASNPLDKARPPPLCFQQGTCEAHA